MSDIPTTESVVNIIVGVLVIGTFIIAWLYAVKPAGQYFREKWLLRKLRIEQQQFEIDWLKARSDIPMFRLDANLNVKWVNEALCDLLDADSQELINKVWFRVIRPAELESVTNKWRKAVEDRSDYTNTQMMFISGKYRKTLVTGDAFVYNGKVREFLGTVKLIEPSKEGE